MRSAFKRLLMLAGVLALALPLAADTVPYQASTHLLAVSFDLDGEAADADQVVASATLADSTSYTIAANPDICRLVDVTITDADSSVSAGVLTVVGTDCWDAALTTTFTFAAGGSGVKTLVVSSGYASGAYYKTVTTVSNALLTGEGVGDALTVGYTGNSPYLYTAFGRPTFDPNRVGRTVDLRGDREVPLKVKNSTSTVLVEVTTDQDPFDFLAVGDLLVFNVSGDTLVRKITTYTSDSQVTVDQAITLPTAGQTFRYKKFYASSDPRDMWIAVNGFDATVFTWDLRSSTNTGGVVSTVECKAAVDYEYPQVQVDTDTIATTVVGQAVSSIDLRLTPNYTHCRVGWKFGTGDDADASAAATESIYASVGLRK